MDSLDRACFNGTGLSEQQHDEESDTLAQMHRLLLLRCMLEITMKRDAIIAFVALHVLPLMHWLQLFA